MTETTAKILIIEDDTFLSKVYQTKLSKEGFDVRLAANGVEGLEMMRKEKPSVVLLDIIMPKLDGFGVLEEVKKDAELSNIPILILSNLGQDSDIEKGKKLGAKDFIVKSDTSLEDVIKKMKEYL